MVIRYLDGSVVEAVLMSRAGQTIRAALKGRDDIIEFVERNGIWISEDCEPVRIEFEWQRRPPAAPVTEADCICPPELAQRLIGLLLAGAEGDGADCAAGRTSRRTSAAGPP